MSYAEPNAQTTGSAAYGDTAAVPVPVPVLVPVAVSNSSAPTPFGESVGASSTRGDFKSGVNSTSASTQNGIDRAADSAHRTTDRAAQGINRSADVAADKANDAAAYGQEKKDQAVSYANDKAGQVKDNVNYASNVAADKANHATNVAADKAQYAKDVTVDKANAASNIAADKLNAANATLKDTAAVANEKAAKAAQIARENLEAAGHQAQVGLQQVQGKVVDLAQQAANHPAVHNATVEVGRQIDGLDRELSKYPLLNDLSAQTHIPKPYLLLAVVLPFLLVITFNILGLASPLTNAIGWAVPAWLTVRALEKEKSGASSTGSNSTLGSSTGVPVPGGYAGQQQQQQQGLTGATTPSVTGSDDKQWLTYWVVFGYLNLLESFALRPLLYYVPYYFLFKLAGIAYLASPSTRGAEKVYYTVVRPTYRHLSARARAAQNSGSYGLKPAGVSAPPTHAAQTAQSGYDAVANTANNGFGTDSYSATSTSASSSGYASNDITGLTHRSIGEKNNNPFVGATSGVAVGQESGVLGGQRIVY